MSAMGPCFRCRRYGHVARNCPQPRDQGDRTPFQQPKATQTRRKTVTSLFKQISSLTAKAPPTTNEDSDTTQGDNNTTPESDPATFPDDNTPEKEEVSWASEMDEPRENADTRH